MERDMKRPGEKSRDERGQEKTRRDRDRKRWRETRKARERYGEKRRDEG